MRLARAEAQAARAFESVAQILERDNAARDSERRALIDAVRRLESIRSNLTGPAQTGEARGDRLPSAARARSEAAVRSQGRGVADRDAPPRARGAAGRGAPPTPPDPRTAAPIDALAPPASRNPEAPDAGCCRSTPRAALPPHRCSTTFEPSPQARRHAARARRSARLRRRPRRDARRDRRHEPEPRRSRAAQRGRRARGRDPRSRAAGGDAASKRSRRIDARSARGDGRRIPRGAEGA